MLLAFQDSCLGTESQGGSLVHGGTTSEADGRFESPHSLNSCSSVGCFSVSSSATRLKSEPAGSGAVPWLQLVLYLLLVVGLCWISSCSAVEIKDTWLRVGIGGGWEAAGDLVERLGLHRPYHFTLPKRRDYRCDPPWLAKNSGC